MVDIYLTHLGDNFSWLGQKNGTSGSCTGQRIAFQLTQVSVSIPEGDWRATQNTS